MGKKLPLSCAFVLVATLSACSGSSNAGDSNGASGGNGNASGGSQTTSGGSQTTSGGNGSGASTSSGGDTSGTPGTPPQIGDCAMFTPDDAWNTEISKLAADATWTSRVQAMVGDKNIHPDYGSDGATLYGIPINVVPMDQALVPVTFDWYPEESDPGPYPFPGVADVKIEGNSPEACDGDCHLLTVQQGTCMLYEGYACEHRADGWHCGNGAKFDLTKNSYGQRPKGWTSADAAGLAITPGILGYDEVRAGKVTHAIRFTMDCTTDMFVKPASHQAVPTGCDPANKPPMGMRVRLKADFDASSLSASAAVVAEAMKTYGMILADNGSDFFFQGEANAGWTDTDIEPLKTIPANAFEVVAMPPLEN